MIDKFKKTFQQATEAIKDLPGSLSDSAIERTYRLFEEWAEIFPILEGYGLHITSFGIGVALSPSMDVELSGSIKDFDEERIKTIIDENEESRSITSVFKAIQTTLDLYDKMETKEFESFRVKVIVKIPPEIRVVLGTPSLI